MNRRNDSAIQIKKNQTKKQKQKTKPTDWVHFFFRHFISGTNSRFYREEKSVPPRKEKKTV